MAALRGSEVFQSPNSHLFFTEVILNRKILVITIFHASWDSSWEVDDADTHVASDNINNGIALSDPPHVGDCWPIRHILGSDGCMRVVFPGPVWEADNFVDVPPMWL